MSVTFIDELPAKASGKKATIFTPEVRAELDAHPGNWALVKTYEKPNGARGYHGAFTKKHGQNGYEAAVRGCDLYLRAVAKDGQRRR